MRSLYSELADFGVEIDELKKLNPTEKQLQDLVKGLHKLSKLVAQAK